MANYMISNHPLNEVNIVTEAFVNLGIEDDPEQVRYVAECQATHITEESSLESCVNALAGLLSVHLAQLNAQRQDKNKGHLYSNPVELIREESKKKKHKQIKHTGNIADAHQRLRKLDSEIVSEETPQQMMKWIFWCTLIGVALLALAIFSVKTNGAVRLAAWLLDSTWFVLLFVLVTFGLSLYFGFASGGVLFIGCVIGTAWIIFKLPGLPSLILNGILFLIAGILLFASAFYIVSLVKYKPLPEEEHRANQARIAEKEALRKELNEYSDLMIEKLDVMKQKFMGDEGWFCSLLSKKFTFTNHNTGKVNQYGGFNTGEIYDFFSFLNSYYRKMRR